MKKFKLTKNSKRFPPSNTTDIIEELNAASTTDFTGLIPSAPQDEFEQDAYEDVFPAGMPENQASI